MPRDASRGPHGGGSSVGRKERWRRSTIFVGGPNIIFMGHSDWGDWTPTDEGFVAQSVVQPASFLAAQEAASPCRALI